MSVVDLLRETRARGEALALVDADRTWSYDELDGAVDGRARSLAKQGIDAGAVVAVTLQPDASAVIEMLALWRLRATAAPLNPKLTEVERAAAEATLGNALGGAQAILWTSGTAGRPRGVAVGYDALRASTEAATERLGLRGDDVWLASLSPAHIGGLALITRALLLGNALVALGPFNAFRVRAALAGSGPGTMHGIGITHLSVVPTQLLRLLDAFGDAPPPASFRCALVGGSGTPRELLARAHQAGWPIALTYGLTEATSQVATAPPDLARRKPGTVGAPLRGVELRVADDGEVLVRGRTLASGYVGGDPGQFFDRDGWLHTGDLGYLDQDGDLWVIGRRAERIVSGGVTVDAVEVEEALRSHPDIADACVVGMPDAEWGERVAAWIEPASGRMDLDEVDAHVRTRLSGAKVPRLYHVGSALPRNINGKIDRRAVLEAFASAGGGAPDTG